MSLRDILSQRAEDEGLPLQVLIKEALQVYALSEIYGQPESRHVTFQGGTCLRLVYEGARYSEDVDFVTSLGIKELRPLFQKVQRGLLRLGPLLEGEIEPRVQKESAQLVRWQARYRAADVPSAFANIEFGFYPAYTARVAPLHVPAHLPGLPLVLVRAEEPKEIMADKVAAIAGRPYVKGRDVFDLWLLQERGIELDRTMVEKKFADYAVPSDGLRQNLPHITPEMVRLELERFLPRRHRTQLRGEALESLVTEVKRLLETMV
jgi:predicted nucleotidyltransferase component of viral defense system